MYSIKSKAHTVELSNSEYISLAWSPNQLLINLYVLFVKL